MRPYSVILAIVIALGHRTADARIVDDMVSNGLSSFISSISDDAKTSTASLTECQVAILPRADGLVRNPRQLTTTDLIGAHTGAITWRTRRVFAVAGEASGAAAVDVDALDAKKKVVQTFRVSAVLYQPGKPAGKWTADGWKVVALHWAVPIADAAATSRAVAGTAPAVPAITDTVISDTAEKYGTKKIAEHKKFDNRALVNLLYNGGTVIGSAPKEMIPGTSAGAAKVEKWKVKLSVADGAWFGAVDVVDGAGIPGADWIVVNIAARTTVKGKEVTQIYRALFVWTRDGGMDAIVTPHVRLAHFSSAH